MSTVGVNCVNQRNPGFSSKKHEKQQQEHEALINHNGDLIHLNEMQPSN
jgi:hypothetical protein